MWYVVARDRCCSPSACCGPAGLGIRNQWASESRACSSEVKWTWLEVMRGLGLPPDLSP
jgi:hypothetical protein